MPPLPHYALMAWCSVKEEQGQIYLYLLPFDGMKHHVEKSNPISLCPFWNLRAKLALNTLKHSCKPRFESLQKQLQTEFITSEAIGYTTVINSAYRHSAALKGTGQKTLGTVLHVLKRQIKQLEWRTSFSCCYLLSYSRFTRNAACWIL
jgi:hypothetical protein